jgi:hypothetical protein
MKTNAKGQARKAGKQAAKKAGNAKGSKELSPAMKALMKKPKDQLTPLEKAHLARALGKGKKTKKKAARLTFKAPADMKPISLKADLVFGKDGHLTQTRFTAIKGKVGSDSAKTIDLGDYDQQTQNMVIARIAGPIFIRGEKKRLPAGIMMQALFRVGKSAKTGAVTVGLKEVKAKLPEKKAKVLAKKDAMYRAIRKAARPMEAAFVKMKPFPSNKELKELAAESDDE